MKKIGTPSPELLRALLRYCPKTGVLTWKPRGREMFKDTRSFTTWNARYAGRRAGWGKEQQRQQVAFGRKNIKAHRVIWAMVHGRYPEREIDHINGNPADNRLANLREVTHAENQRNQRARSGTASGEMGVTWHAGAKKWRARMGAGSGTHIGYFETIEAAVEARAKALKKHGYHPNHGRRDAH